MSDYSLQLDCGCINFCKCELLQERQSAAEQGFKATSLKITQEVWECQECFALVMDYKKHKDWHLI